MAFPAITAVHRRIPKEAFYKHLTLTKVLKEKFITDVDRIFVENSFTKDNLNLAARILGVMEADERGKILGVMDSEIAARITKIMDPES